MQSDLFQFASTSPFQVPKNSIMDRFRVTLRLEHAALFGIGLVLLYTFVYSWGVEKGKKMATNDFQVIASKLQEQIFSKEDAHQATVMIDTTRIPAPPASSAVVEREQRVDAPVSWPRIELLQGAEPAVSASEAGTEKRAEAKSPQGKFTIQLVAYRTQDEAQRLLDKLSAKGYEGFVIPGGSFQQVCVNGFETRAGAAEFLKKLKLEGIAPSDAYVRNIPRP